MMIRWFFLRLWKICLYLSLGSCITCVFVDWHLGWVRDPMILSLDLRLWRFMKILMVIQRTYYFNTLSLWITFWLMTLLTVMLALNAVRCNTLCYMDGTLDELNAAVNKYSKFWNTYLELLYSTYIFIRCAEICTFPVLYLSQVPMGGRTAQTQPFSLRNLNPIWGEQCNASLCAWQEWWHTTLMRYIYSLLITYTLTAPLVEI